MYTSFIAVILTTIIICLAGSSGALAKPAAIPSAESLKEAVIKSDVLEKEYRQQVYASYENGVASVSLFRHPDATRADCKIDTILLARKIISLDPHDIKLVRCVFYDYDRQNQFWEVEVRAQLITAFAEGKIAQHELINSVLLSEDTQKTPLSAKYASLSYSGILNENSVCKGACEDRRLAINLRLKEIEQQGIQLGHFRDDFLRIEDAARRGKDAELPNQISALNKSLDDYVQEMVKAGQLQKPDLRRSKNSIGSHEQQKLDPKLGL